MFDVYKSLNYNSVSTHPQTQKQKISNLVECYLQVKIKLVLGSKLVAVCSEIMHNQVFYPPWIG